MLDGYTQRGSERTVSKSTLFNYMNTKDRIRTKRERERQRHTREVYFTIPRDDAEGDCVARFLDEVDNVRVGFVGDGTSIYCQDPVSHFQLAASVSRAPLNNPTYFVRHGHTCIACFDSQF